MSAREHKRLNRLGVALIGACLGSLLLPAGGQAANRGVPAQFRGCDAVVGWCHFWVEPRETADEPLHRVRPLGIPEMHGNDPISIAVRDRLNALMSSFVHQHKRIVLYDLRRLEDGSFEAEITVNESPLRDDPPLQALAAERR
jgi:hypothetical protein